MIQTILRMKTDSCYWVSVRISGYLLFLIVYEKQTM